MLHTTPQLNEPGFARALAPFSVVAPVTRIDGASARDLGYTAV